MTTENEEKGFQYPYEILNKFANEIVFDYDGDFYKFLLEKKAITEDKTVLEYVNSANYYQKFVEGTPYYDVNDFFRPKAPMSFWSRMYDQAIKIILAKIEQEYADIISSGEPDPRTAMIDKVKRQLATLNLK